MIVQSSVRGDKPSLCELFQIRDEAGDLGIPRAEVHRSVWGGVRAQQTLQYVRPQLLHPGENWQVDGFDSLLLVHLS